MIAVGEPQPMRSVDARAVRAGAGIGGVVELGKQKITEIRKGGWDEVKARIGLKKAEGQIRGNDQATTVVKFLGQAIVGGTEGIGALVEGTSKFLENHAYKVADKATKHEDKLASVKGKPVEQQNLLLNNDLANLTLDMFDLPGGAPQIKERTFLGRLVDRSAEGLRKMIDGASEKYHGWRSEADNRGAERSLKFATTFEDSAKAISRLANEFDIIIGNRSVPKVEVPQPKVEVPQDGQPVSLPPGEKARLHRVDLDESKASAVVDESSAKTVREKAERQFREVTTAGADIAVGGGEQIRQKDIGNVQAQEKILADIKRAVTKTGTDTV